MTVKVGINGFGRIGRCVLRALQNSGHDIKVEKVNDLCDVNMSAHLLAHDTTHGSFGAKVDVEGDSLLAGDQKILYSSEARRHSPWMG